MINRALGIAAMSTAVLVGCSRRELSGPPELRIGRDQCAECGMFVSEDRFSSASLVERDGERLYLFFDDIGCMLDHEHAETNKSVVERYVHDYDSRAWVAGEKAAYLMAMPDRLRTPMGSGIAAFESGGTAERAQAEFGGTLLPHSELAAARRAWMEERFGKPGEKR